MQKVYEVSINKGSGDSFIEPTPIARMTDDLSSATDDRMKANAKGYKRWVHILELLSAMGQPIVFDTDTDASESADGTFVKFKVDADIDRMFYTDEDGTVYSADEAIKHVIAFVMSSEYTTKLIFNIQPSGSLPRPLVPVAKTEWTVIDAIADDIDAGKALVTITEQ